MKYYDVVAKGNFADISSHDTPDVVLGSEFSDKSTAKIFARGASALLQQLPETSKWMDIWLVTIEETEEYDEQDSYKLNRKELDRERI